MNNNSKISNHQAFYIILGGIFGDAILSLPRSAVNIGNQAGWFVSLLASVVILIAATAVGLLARRFYTKTIYESAPEILGTIMGKAFGLLLLIYFAATATVVLRVIPFLFKITMMPYLPVWFIIAMFLIACMFTAYMGVETLARVNEVIMPVVLIIVVAMLLTVLPFVRLYRVFPLFYGFQWDKILSLDFGILFYSSSAFALIFLLPPFMEDPQEIVTVGQKAVILPALFYAVVTFLCITTLTPKLTMEQVWPTVRLFNIPAFRGFLIERLDVIFAFMWSLAAYTTALNYFFATVESTQRIFHLKQRKGVILFWAVVIFFGAQQIKDYLDEGIVVQIIGVYSLIVCFFLPAGILLLAKLRKRGETENA